MTDGETETQRGDLTSLRSQTNTGRARTNQDQVQSSPSLLFLPTSHSPFQSGLSLHPDFSLLHLTSACCNHPHEAQFQRSSSGKPSWLLPLKFLNFVCASLLTPGIVFCAHNLSCTPGGQGPRTLPARFSLVCSVPSIYLLTYTIFPTAWHGEGFQKGSPN